MDPDGARTFDTHYIGGAWTPARTPGRPAVAVLGAADGEVVGRVPAADAADVDAAVAAARAGFDDWAATAPTDRAAALGSLRQALTSRAEALATSIAVEVGCPLKIARKVQVGAPLATLGSYVTLAADYAYDTEVGNSLLTREPVGVVAAITPWNYPLHQAMNKVAAALAAGCTVVLKPSQVAPLTAFMLAEAAHEAGLPAGVLNVICGPGEVVGDALAGHPGVDMVSFTGSTEAGARVAQRAAANITRVGLELGGKSANVILDDADLATAVTSGVNNAFLNSGQTCSAWTRMLVPAGLQDEALAIAEKAVARLRVGHPLAEGTRLGPLASTEQVTTVRTYIEVGIAEGARPAIGGLAGVAGLPIEHYVAPTVFADVRADMRIAREEIFGPVLAVLPYGEEADAVRIANDSEYGLHGGVWSADTDRAVALARRIRTGQVDVNGGAWNPMAPFGGYKKSGIGREMGAAGLEEFQQIKAIQR